MTTNENCKHSDTSSDRIMALTSTPSGVRQRRALSLLDVSEIPSFEKTKLNVSLETLGSNSSICKDSGYNHSESSLVSDKTKGDGNYSQLEYSRLLEDLKFKDIMISSLYESNHNLRLKLAEAENKITELRFKCESHCRCCTYRNQNVSFDGRPPDRHSPQIKYNISAFAQSEPCLIPTIPKAESFREKPSNLPTDNSFSKVKHWQKSVDNLKDWHKKINDCVSSPIPTPKKNIDLSRRYVRPPPEPLPKAMSYMETSRALAEAYQKWKERNADAFSLQVIGDHAVSVTPLQLVPSDPPSTLVSPMKNKNKSSKEEIPSGAMNYEAEKQDIINSLLLTNQSQSSSKLLDCLREANKYSTSLTTGLSRLPGELDKIRCVCEQIQDIVSDDRELLTALAYGCFSLSFLSFLCGYLW